MSDNFPDGGPARRGLHHRVRHHTSQAREAWKRYYHFKRLDEHGNHITWHGRQGWTRAILTGLVVIAVAAWGLYRAAESFFAP